MGLLLQIVDTFRANPLRRRGKEIPRYYYKIQGQTDIKALLVYTSHNYTR